MTLNIKTVAQLKHINVRKEGPEEDNVTAIDLKLTGRVPSDFIDRLMVPDDEGGMTPTMAFWDADGDPRFLSMKDVGIYRETTNRPRSRSAASAPVTCLGTAPARLTARCVRRMKRSRADEHTNH